jgi:peptidoglycan biosynthesis protein MviN/MurJ (putative lipid II flippase)
MLTHLPISGSKKKPRDARPRSMLKAVVLPTLSRCKVDRDRRSAVACLQDGVETCMIHLRFPLAHRRVIRTTNLLARLFGE